MDPQPSQPPAVNKAALKPDHNILLPAEDLDQYVYTPLKEGQIRLLEILPGEPNGPIQCRLHIVSLDDKLRPPYGAISYTWGDDMTDKSVFVDGRRVNAKPNLEAALLEFRRQPPKLVSQTWRERLRAAQETLRTLRVIYPFLSVELNKILKQFKNQKSTALEELTSTEDSKAREEAREALCDGLITNAREEWNRIASIQHLLEFDLVPYLLLIDGLCINQADLEERAAQVQLMASVYSRASFLVVWLGVT